MKTITGILRGVLAGVVSVLVFSTFTTAATLEIRSKDGIGNYLTDEKGMTLYLFKKDSPGVSACAGPCVEKWPLFTAQDVTVPDGVSAEDFGTITREDGKKQTTYKGLPLYYFFKDKNAGDTTGQAVNNVWFVVAP
jgi:predicted lipoprotein with Yx(FWY)xxD motif